jgi:predicted Zn-dependent protease
VGRPSALGAECHFDGGGDTQTTTVTLGRAIAGAFASSATNQLDDAGLQWLVRKTERDLQDEDQDPLMYPEEFKPKVAWENHPVSDPPIWFDATYQLDDAARAAALAPLLAEVEVHHLSSAGFLQVDAQAASVVDDWGSVKRYAKRTRAQFSITVRDPAHRASGWAGVDFNEWRRIDTLALTRIAIDKCERSRDPVGVEPGRFTTILEPQAVTDLVAPMIDTSNFSGVNGNALSRYAAEDQGIGPFFRRKTNSVAIGERVIDERFSLVADPMDPDCAFLPFDWSGEPYLPTEWIQHGVLRNLDYDRYKGIRDLGLDRALPNSEAFRLVWHGPITSMPDMIASTERGLLITRFSNINIIDDTSMVMTGNTRDGVWLIEHGKISKAVRNFRFSDSILFKLNSIEQVGAAQRTFRPHAPAVAPAIKVRDFNMVGLLDAV